MKKKLKLKKSVKEKLFNITILAMFYVTIICGILMISYQNNNQKITDSIAVNQLEN